jgi:hypothetical protein
MSFEPDDRRREGFGEEYFAGGGQAIPIPERLVQKALSPQAKRFVESTKAITPRPFMEGVHGLDLDVKLLGVAALALQDYNSMPPGENWTFESLPVGLSTIISFGTQFYLATLKQMEVSLIDISYSDNGLSINFNRVANLGTAIATLEKPWLRMMENRKKLVIVGIAANAPGLATPRFQSNLSRFIGMLGNGAYGWNIP